MADSRERAPGLSAAAGQRAAADGSMIRARVAMIA
jgi:hypothetical protein